MFVKEKYWEYSKCPLINVLINYDVSFTTKHCKVDKKKKIDLHTMTWMYVQGMLLIESKRICRDFPGGPTVKNPPCNAGEVGSIPGQRTRIPQAVEKPSPNLTTTEPQPESPHATN